MGQADLRQSLLAALMTRGHVLIESVPGLAKTTAAQTLASAVSGSFRRIQCTPDLMPSDIVGTQIYNQQEGTFITQLGPVHANFVLLDEINRSSAKTQSAMLEAMQEGQTTIGGENHRLPQPFMVMATQNPIEEEGTYVLPEAQMDRFLMKVVISYPSASEEAEVLEMIDAGAFNRPRVATPISLAELEEAPDLHVPGLRLSRDQGVHRRRHQHDARGRPQSAARPRQTPADGRVSPRWHSPNESCPGARTHERSQLCGPR